MGAPDSRGSSETAGGFLSISEPNTQRSLQVDADTLRQLRTEDIRARMLPRQFEALESLGMIDEVIDRMLIMEAEECDDTTVLNVEWTDIDIEVVLDSGCSDHVMDVEREAPGYYIACLLYTSDAADE